MTADGLRYLVVSVSVFVGGFLLLGAVLYYRTVWEQRSWRMQTVGVLLLLELSLGLAGDALDTLDHYGQPFTWRAFVYPPTLGLLLAISVLTFWEYRIIRRHYESARKLFSAKRGGHDHRH